ncbi:MAG: PadR family transcriptional regulator [Gemmatimonadota bacterium]|nr:PadR family transcriptional regulator [Gemmatimonadota bacterium]
MTEPMSVLKGTLDVLALKALSWQPMHGYALTRWLERRSGERLALEDAALYQALYRLEKRGLVAAEWGKTDEGRRARFYELTRAGRDELVEETAHWLRYAETVSDILTATPGTSAAGGTL